MANVKCFVKKQSSVLIYCLLAIVAVSGIFSFQANASIKNKSGVDAPNEDNPQMINLNMRFKAKNKITESNLTMPFYQKAEIEKKFDDQNNILIEVNPRYGKNNKEIEIEMKFYKASGTKAFAKKEFLAKLGEESKVRVKGMTIKVTPLL